MRTYRGKGPRVLILVIVCVLLAGFSIGFSALSQSLLIKSHASIKPDIESLVVKFSSNADSLETEDVEPTVSSDNVTASNAIIDNENIMGPTISNFSVELTEAGDKATYVFYAINMGATDAYLTNIVYNNVSGKSSPKACTPIYGTTESDATMLCENIKLTVQVGSVSTTASTSVTGHVLAAGASEQITITVEYINNVTASSTAGDFIVEFGDISLIYSSVDGEDDSGDVETDGGYDNVDTDGGYDSGGSGGDSGDSSQDWYFELLDHNSSQTPTLTSGPEDIYPTLKTLANDGDYVSIGVVNAENFGGIQINDENCSENNISITSESDNSWGITNNNNDYGNYSCTITFITGNDGVGDFKALTVSFVWQ